MKLMKKSSRMKGKHTSGKCVAKWPFLPTKKSKLSLGNSKTFKSFTVSSTCAGAWWTSLALQQIQVCAPVSSGLAQSNAQAVLLNALREAFSSCLTKLSSHMSYVFRLQSVYLISPSFSLPLPLLSTPLSPEENNHNVPIACRNRQLSSPLPSGHTLVSQLPSTYESFCFD